jgi:uncharacterized protein (TIGR02246 family)
VVPARPQLSRDPLGSEIGARLNAEECQVTTLRMLGALLLATLVVLLGRPAWSSGEAPGNPADLDAIRQVITETTAAFNLRDARAFARYYTPDAWLVTVRGESMAGTAEIEDGLTPIFASRAKSAKLETLDVSIRFIRPDVALGHVLNELSGLKSPTGDLLPAHRELSIRVFVKNDGLWRVTAFHNTIVRPFGSESNPAQR